MKPIKRSVMRILVWNMRWMTRYAGFIARPLVSWYAGREVIACGLAARERGAVSLIYTPWHSRGEHSFYVRRGRSWVPIEAIPVEDFSGALVRQVLLPSVQPGDVCQARAADLTSGRTTSSPPITVKPGTKEDAALLRIQALPGGEALFSWPQAGLHDPMIYFLTLEGRTGNALVGVYTRETSWRYPRLKDASLAVGGTELPPLVAGETYTAKWVLVDFDGWVAEMAVKSFEQQILPGFGADSG
ncbi:MAG: hypothetical protein SCH98_05620 [Deferrisomatales bacterium]|nr:hypothetical protein [Deferrisomatales bacterium]